MNIFKSFGLKKGREKPYGDSGRFTIPEKTIPRTDEGEEFDLAQEAYEIEEDARRRTRPFTAARGRVMRKKNPRWKTDPYEARSQKTSVRTVPQPGDEDITIANVMNMLKVFGLYKEKEEEDKEKTPNGHAPEEGDNGD